ncbi:MAG TPA: alpha/beta fold hydrolase [Pseudonocardia sp.]|nr:alpha/beta fold hydrolase [Pseudonocardia sp.]
MRPDTTTHAAQLTAVRARFVARTTTADGVRLSGTHLTDPEKPQVTALVHAHGFTHRTSYSATKRVLTAFAEHVDVVAFDLRGHGRSGGRNTVGDREVLDVDAAVAWARAAGYARVATVGFSLGAAVALRQAALGEHRPDAVVAVSGPARWYSRETVAMRRVHWALEQPHGRAVARLLGVRLDRPWVQVPPSPVEVVGAIAPTPLLLVHFTADPYFSAAHPRALAAATGGHAQLWTEPGDGHGETGTDAALAGRIAAWACRAVDADGGPPDGSRPARSTVEGDAPADRRAASSEVR